MISFVELLFYFLLACLFCGLSSGLCVAGSVSLLCLFLLLGCGWRISMMHFGISGLTVPWRIAFRITKEMSVSSPGTSYVAALEKFLNVSLMKILIRMGRSLLQLFCNGQSLIVFFCIHDIQTSAFLPPSSWRRKYGGAWCTMPLLYS